MSKLLNFLACSMASSTLRRSSNWVRMTSDTRRNICRLSITTFASGIPGESGAFPTKPQPLFYRPGTVCCIRNWPPLLNVRKVLLGTLTPNTCIGGGHTVCEYKSPEISNLPPGSRLWYTYCHRHLLWKVLSPHCEWLEEHHTGYCTSRFPS